MSDKSVVDQIKHYQRDIKKCPDNAKRMIRCIERLMVLPVTIAHLQETGVGRSVNDLRKCGGEVGAAANSLVCKWKSMVQAEEDSEAESEVEEDQPKETLYVFSPDAVSPDGSPRINESVVKLKNESVDKHKKTHNSEEHRKPKSDHGPKRSESSHSDLKSSDLKKSDKHDHKSDRSKSSKSDPGYGSDSKHSSRHLSKSDSRSNKKSHSSYRSESECNGDIKTEQSSSKTKFDDTKSSKSSSVENKNKDLKQKTDKEKHRREDSPHRREKENRRREERSHRSGSSSSSRKYDARRVDSESSDDDNVYKPRSKRKKSESEEDRKPQIRGRIKSESEEDQKHIDDKYNGRSKHRDSKRQDSSEDSDERDGSEEEENSQTSSRNSESRNESDNEEEMSGRSSPNNMSDNEVESDKRSSPGDAGNEDNNSDKTSDSDESEMYVPTKIKREKESPPRHSYSPSNKNKSSHSRSSHTSTHHSSTGNHSFTHNSKSHVKNDKVSSSKKESFENIKVKKEKDENEDFKKRREDKPGDKKSHKPSSSHSNSSSKESNKTDKKVKIVKIEKEVDGSIDCVSGASFADALMGLSEPKKKSAKRKSTPSTPEKSSKSVEKPAEGKSKSLIKTEPRISSSSSSSSKTGFKEPELLSKNIKLEPLDVDLKSTLPEISPHYKPLPHYSPPSSPPGKRTKLLSQEEALSTIMSTKNQRTKVYSGNKSGYLKVPSLFDLCIQVLRDNIEALEYTGGVPYDLLKPVLDRATAVQLFQLEHYNPYLVEDTDGLWKFHCNKDFRGKEPDEFETWRELYVRLLDERERKLEALKANITQSMAKNTPVRQTKLAYVDSVVKPPRNIAKKQMKFGTGKAVKHDLVSKAMVGAAGSSPAPAAVPVPAPPATARSSNPNAFPIPNFLKKKKAPLMQKTLQLIKGNRFKR